MILDRSIAPEFQIPDKIDFPEINKRTLKNGVRLYFIPTPEIQAIKLEFISDAPGILGLKEKKMASYFALHMLMEGTFSKTSAELDDFFDTYASEVDVISTFERQGLSLLTTKKHFLKVLPVFRALLTEANFPDKELAKRKSQKKLSISIQREKTSHRASQLFRQSLFGADHPFGQIVTEDDIEAIERDDLTAMYPSSLWVNSEIFLTGNLDDSDLVQIEELFANLPVIQRPQLPGNFQNLPQTRIIEDRENALQSSIRVGCHVLPKTHPDYFGFWVFNVFLGGYFGSRLIKNIREEKGHTYGIYSSIGSLKSSDYWVVMADVIKENREQVIEEIYLEIDKLQEQTISLDELQVVRNYLIGNLLSSFSSSFELISRFKSVHQAGLDLDFFKNQLEFIKTFKAEDIQEIGKKYLQKDLMVEILVG